MAGAVPILDAMADNPASPRDRIDLGQQAGKGMLQPAVAIPTENVGVGSKPVLAAPNVR
jgi:hypothetical protein